VGAHYTVRETISADKTLDAEDSGKLFWVDTDAKIITLPAIAAGLDGFVRRQRRRVRRRGRERQPGTRPT
jgi:hypothetical protein